MDKRSRFTELIKEHEQLIFKVATLYTNSREDMEDLYQEIIFQLWKSFNTFRDESKLSTWMYRVAMNTAIYTLKNSKRQVTTTPINVSTESVMDSANRSAEDKLKLLHQSLQVLNLLEKGIILLYMEGKSYYEIGKLLGLTTSNVGTKISRIKEKLKSQINKNR